MTFRIRKALFFTKAVEFCLILKISNRDLIVCKATIGINLACVININTSITDCKPMLLKSRRSIQDKIVQILITTIKLLDSICRIQSNNF